MSGARYFAAQAIHPGSAAPGVLPGVENRLMGMAPAADNAAMTEPPKCKCRRFQFRLRTLLIVVTLLAVVCGYVGRQIEIVRARQSLLTLLVAEGGGYWNRETENTYSIVGAVPAYFSPGTYRVLSNGKPDQRPPTIRRWLGDGYIYVIWLPESVADIDATRFAKGFPEAAVAQENRAAAATISGQAIGPRS